MYSWYWIIVKTSITFPSGNCFTFNSKLNDQDEYAGNRISSMTGPQGCSFLSETKSTGLHSRGNVCVSVCLCYFAT